MHNHTEPATPDTGTGSDKDPTSPAVWVVRPESDAHLKQFVALKYVGIGWIDVSTVNSRDDIWELVRNAYPTGRSHIVGQLHAFKIEIVEGDYVISPQQEQRDLRFGRIVGPCRTSSGIDGTSIRNYRSVDWQNRTLGWSTISDTLRTTLRSNRSVFRVRDPDEFFRLIALPPDEDGLDREHDDPELETKRRPFDPAKIRVRPLRIVVTQLVSRVQHQEMDLSPDFQRKAGIWSLQQKSRLIESLLLNIPIPVFYVAETRDDTWAIIDGLQRTSTIFSFVENEFSLKYLEYRTDFNGKYYQDLPRPMRRRIDETQLHFNVIEHGTPEEVMFNIFHRINTGGKPLNGQEIRNALHRGVNCRTLLRDLAESDEFRKATDYSVKCHRMADQECVLRFLAFYVEKWEDYSGNSLDVHLGQIMDKLNNISLAEREQLREDFLRSMNAAYHIFGAYAFRKSGLGGGPKSPISKPLFEAWSVALARCSDDDLRQLLKRSDEICRKFTQLVIHDAEFEKSISSATATRWRIKKRFETIHKLVQGLI